MATANSIVARFIRVYYATSSEAADAIERHDFSDSRGTHLSPEDFSGVWVVDLPLDPDEGAPGSAAFFIINIP